MDDDDSLALPPHVLYFWLHQTVFVWEFLRKSLQFQFKLILSGKCRKSQTIELKGWGVVLVHLYKRTTLLGIRCWYQADDDDDQRREAQKQSVKYFQAQVEKGISDELS